MLLIRTAAVVATVAALALMAVAGIRAARIDTTAIDTSAQVQPVSAVVRDAIVLAEAAESAATRPDGVSSLPLIPPREPGADRGAPTTGPEAASDAVAQTGAAAGDGASQVEGDGDLDTTGVQARLAELRYYDGPLDGRTGIALTTALQAFQKVQGITIDGQAGEETLAALADPVRPTLAAGPADRVEIDLDRQVMYVVAAGRIDRIMPVSSGNGDPYSLPGGGRAESLTPVGTFAIERRIQGTVNAHFGTLYDPMYFHQGWAIHGSNNVPTTPASHGCVRLPRRDAEWLFSQADVGTTVLVYGAQNAFAPSLGETAGTTQPAGEVVTDPGPPPPPPPSQAFG